MATKKTKTKTYKSDEEYIAKHIVFRDFGEYQMYGTFNTADGFGFSAQMFKTGRSTKSYLTEQIVRMVLKSGREVRGYYDE